MADKVGSVYIEIQAKMGSLERDLKQLEARLQGTDTKAKQMSSSLMSMGQVIGGSLITGAIIGMGKAALTAAAQMEQNRVAFTTMLGSAEKANQLLKDMTEFAAATPFELPEIVTAGKQMLAFGFGADEVIKNLRMLGDVSAGLSVPIGDMVYLFGQIKTQGRAMTQDLMQFANRGVPIFDELAKVLGVSSDQVKKFAEQGKIGFNEIEQVFKNLTAEGSKFGGLMEAQSKTLAGQWSNFNDNIGKTAVIIGNEMMPAAKTWLELANNIVSSFNKSGEKTESTFDKVLDKVTSVMIPVKGLLELHTWIADKINEQFESTKNVSDLIDDHYNAVLKLAEGYSKTDAAVKKTATTTKAVNSEFKKAYDERLAYFDKLLKDQDALVEKYGNLEYGMFVEKLEKMMAKYQTFISGLTGLSSQLSSLVAMDANNQTTAIDNRTQNQLDAIEEVYNAEVEAINNSTMSEAEKNLALKALDEQRARDEKSIQDKAEKEKRKIAREAAKIQKQLSLFETAVEIPTAAFQAFSSAQVLPFPASAIVGAAMASAATALGVAKLKLISDQPLPALAQGGIVPPVPGGNQFTIGEAGSAEAVIPLNDQTLGRLAGMINSAGGGQSFVKLPPMSDTALYNMIFQASQNGDLFIASRSVVNR